MYEARQSSLLDRDEAEPDVQPRGIAFSRFLPAVRSLADLADILISIYDLELGILYSLD